MWHRKITLKFLTECKLISFIFKVSPSGISVSLKANVFSANLSHNRQLEGGDWGAIIFFVDNELPKDLSSSPKLIVNSVLGSRGSALVPNKFTWYLLAVKQSMPSDTFVFDVSSLSWLTILILKLIFNLTSFLNWIKTWLRERLKLPNTGYLACSCFYFHISRIALVVLILNIPHYIKKCLISC